MRRDGLWRPVGGRWRSNGGYGSALWWLVIFVVRLLAMLASLLLPVFVPVVPAVVVLLFFSGDRVGCYGVRNG